MSTLKVNTIQDTTGNDALTIDSSGNVTASQGFIPSTQLSHRNLIINGAMQVNQRGDVTSQTSGGYKACDRYSIRQVDSYLNVSTFDVTQETTSPPNGFKYYYQLKTLTGDTPSGNEAGSIRYTVEDKDIENFGFGTSDAKAFTLSFWVKASVAGTYTVGFVSGNLDYSYIAEYTISSADTWEYVSISVTAPTSGTWSSSGKGMEIHWNVAGASGGSYSTTAGSWVSGSYRYSNNQVNNTATANNTFNFTGVQLEVGSVATPFEHRSYGEELARCQRYYYKHDTGNGGSYIFIGSGGTARSSTSQTSIVQYPVRMRSSPTLTSTSITSTRLLIANTSTAVSSIAADQLGVLQAAITVNVSSGLTAGSYYMWLAWGSQAPTVNFDAEL